MCLTLVGTARAQVAPPPAYLAVVQGDATLERAGETIPATQNMPFVERDRLRTTNGRVQIAFPDGTAIEVAEFSEVECLSPTRVRLLAGTMDHVQRVESSTVSSNYLPPDLDVYGSTLDQFGSWQYASPYGYVWYPAVAADWRPYYYGNWSPVSSYGWTWVGVDAWTWPTHHYGRWGYANSRWFWIPGRTWGPGWVSWGTSPDYVSWCPLGFDGRPVFGLSVGHGTSWLGWTVLPRGTFGTRGSFANQVAVDFRRLPPSTAFIVHNTPPFPARFAGRPPAFSNGRGTAVGVAVPRQSAPRQLPTELHRDRRPGQPLENQVPTHYGIAVPRTPPGATPPAAAPAPARRPGTATRGPSGDRTPGQYQVPRVTPRAPAPPAAAPPQGASPPPAAAPRSTPPARSHTTPSQAPPHASPPPARSAPPPSAAPRGEAHSRGGRGR